MTVSLLHSVPADGSFSAAGAAAWDAQHVFTQATDRLLGRTTAGVGATEEISVGAGLTLSGGTLVNAGATSPIGGSDTQVQFNDGGVFAGNANFTFNKATNQIAIGAGTAAAPTLIPTGDTNTGVWFPAADTIAASTGGTERFRILSSGSVGIGTSSPDALLSVNGVASFGAGAVATPSVAAFGDLDTGMWFPAANTLAWSTGGTERLRIDSSGNVGIGTSSPLGAAGYAWLTIKGTNNGAVFSLSADGGEQFRLQLFDAAVVALYTTTNIPMVLSPNNAEVMRVTPVGGGRVAIGTANPTTLLSVNGVASFGAGTAALPSVAAFGDLNTGVWFPAADTIAASTGGTERFRILSSGSVSIGTTSDFNLLGVVSTTSGTRISVNTFTVTTGDFTGIDFGVTNGVGTSKKGGILFERTGAGGVGTIHLAINNAVSAANVGLADSRLAILSSGNVGIGTSSPTTLLSVNGVASFGAGTAALPSVAAFGDLDTGMWFPAANTIAWSTGGSERLRITSAGNLGLGTSTFGTSAATAFAIATGTAPTTGPADTIQIYSTDLSAGNTMLSLYTEGTVVNTNIVAATTHRIAIRVNGTVYYLLANTSA